METIDQSTVMAYPAKKPRGCLGCLGIVLMLILMLVLLLYFNPSNRFPAPALEALRSDPKALIYSLDPSELPRTEPATTPAFHHFRILGETTLGEQEERNLCAHELQHATHWAWEEEACFMPRHGFRVTGPEGVYDFVVCFACGQAEVYLNGETIRHVRIQGRSEALNRLLKAHQVPLPPQ